MHVSSLMGLLSESLPAGVIEKACLGLAVCPHLFDALAGVYGQGVALISGAATVLSDGIGRVRAQFSHTCRCSEICNIASPHTTHVPT